METTTIYTKVAVIRQQQVQSPLDVLNGKAPPKLPQATTPPVGKMRINLEPRENRQAADVRLTILSEDSCSIDLDGIVVREPRPGWITLEIPPLDGSS